MILDELCYMHFGALEPKLNLSASFSSAHGRGIDPP